MIEIKAVAMSQVLGRRGANKSIIQQLARTSVIEINPDGAPPR
jgi:hypothetical protein